MEMSIMRGGLIIFLIVLLGIGCKKQVEERIEREFNEALALELKQRAKIDQTAAWIPQGRFKSYSSEAWQAYKDSVFTTNKVFLEEVLNEYGYPGVDLVGEEGELNYWLMVQHCDFDPDFQAKVLDLLKKQVDVGNASGSHFGLLTDRVRFNTGKKQIYGTQVTYREETGQAIPKPLADSLSVNERRAAVGLEPIEMYLNDMSRSHFEMNKEYMLQKDITEPTLYEVEE